MFVLPVLFKDEYLFLCKDTIDCFHGIQDFCFLACLNLRRGRVGELNPVGYLSCCQERELEPVRLWCPQAQNDLHLKVVCDYQLTIESLILGKIEGRRRRGQQRMRDSWMASLTQWI